MYPSKLTTIYPMAAPPAYQQNAKKNNRKKSKALIVGDSHIKRLSKTVMKHAVKDQIVIQKSFDGAPTRHLKHNILPFLHEEQPNSVIIHAGTNNLHEYLLNVTRPDELAKEIIDIGKLCKEFQVENISISGILPRENKDIQKVTDEVNNLLKSMCEFNNFNFISNTNIDISCIYDTIHTNDIGSRIFRNKFYWGFK